MKRWMISAAITLGLLLILIIASFYIPESKTFEGKIASGESVVTVIKKHKTVKKEKQKPKPEKTIASPDAVVSEPEPEEPEEQEPETEELTDPDATEDAEETTLSAEGQKAEESYKQYALKRIAAKKVYPMSARAKGQQGNVKIRAVIDTDGKLLNAEITSACEFDVLNEAALNAVKKAAPFKKMQPGARKLELNFTMEFSLK